MCSALTLGPGCPGLGKDHQTRRAGYGRALRPAGQDARTERRHPGKTLLQVRAMRSESTAFLRGGSPQRHLLRGPLRTRPRLAFFTKAKTLVGAAFGRTIP